MDTDAVLDQQMVFGYRDATLAIVPPSSSITEIKKLENGELSARFEVSGISPARQTRLNGTVRLTSTDGPSKSLLGSSIA